MEVLLCCGLYYGGYVVISGMYGLWCCFVLLIGMGVVIVLCCVCVIVMFGCVLLVMCLLFVGGMCMFVISVLVLVFCVFEVGLLFVVFGYVLDFSGYNVVYLFSFVKVCGFVFGKYFIYVYGGGECIVYWFGKLCVVIMVNV